MGIRSIARAVTVLIVAASAIAATSSPAAAGIPSGAGWAAGFYFTGMQAAQFWVDVPGGTVNGTAAYNASGTVVSLTMQVTKTTAGGPCVAGSVMDDAPTTVMFDSTCKAGTVSTSVTDTPVGDYQVEICTNVCNIMYALALSNDAFYPTGTFGSWAYTSATQASVSMKIGPASFSATLTSAGNARTGSGTLTLANSPSSCGIIEQIAGGPFAKRCSAGTSPLTFTVSSPNSVILEITYTQFNFENFFDMFIPIPE